MLLKGKGWAAQEFYNEYLDLKVEISSLTRQLEFPGLDDDLRLFLQDKLDEKVHRLRFVLNQLQLRGIKLEDLILLSLGVDVK